MLVICLTRCFSLFLLFCLLFVHQSVFSRFWKKIISFAHKTQNFSSFSLSLSFFEKDDRLTQRERESFVIYRCLIKHDVIHIHFDMSSTPNVPSTPPSDPFAPNPPPVPGILITKVRFLNRFLKREKERETNNRNVLLREDHLSSPAGWFFKKSLSLLLSLLLSRVVSGARFWSDETYVWWCWVLLHHHHHLRASLVA